MIYKLKGQIDEILSDAIVLDVSGVSCYVLCSRRTLSKAPTVGQNCTLYTEMVIREDAHILFGFFDLEERQWFRLLTTVQGVGNRVALTLLSLADGSTLAQAIVRQDKEFITRADGVGPKLAARLITELKDKVDKISAILPNAVVCQQSGAPHGGAFDDTAKDAVSALVSLGYRLFEANTVVQALVQQATTPLTVSDLIRQALMRLTKG